MLPTRKTGLLFNFLRSHEAFYPIPDCERPLRAAKTLEDPFPMEALTFPTGSGGFFPIPESENGYRDSPAILSGPDGLSEGSSRILRWKGHHQAASRK
jgi:hypothetical protein